MYCLVITDNYSRFTRVFFLATKDETSSILKSFITRIGNLVDHKVKVIRCDNVTEFKNREMHLFCKIKGILRQFIVAKTPQQNGVAKRRNKILIEAAKTMLADSKLPTTFLGKITIFNTKDHLEEFNGKADEGFFDGYSLNSKALRVFNSRTRIVEENLHIRFSENTINVVGSGPDWLFDIDALTRTMNYEPIVSGTQSNSFLDPKSSHDDGFKPSSDDGKKVDEDLRKGIKCNDQEKEMNVNNTNNVNTVSSTVNVASTNEDNELPFDPHMPALEDVGTFYFLNDYNVIYLNGEFNLNRSIHGIHAPLTGHPVKKLTTYDKGGLYGNKNGNQIRFLIQRVQSGRTLKALSIPRRCRVMTNALTRSGFIRTLRLKASATTFAFPGWHDMSLALVVDCFQWLALCFCSSWSGWENEFHHDKASSVRVPIANFTLQSSVQFLRENTDSVCSNQRMSPTAPSVPLKFKEIGSLPSGSVNLTGDEDPTNEDGDNGINDPIGGSISLGGVELLRSVPHVSPEESYKNFLLFQISEKFQGSNRGDNTRDGGRSIRVGGGGISNSYKCFPVRLLGPTDPQMDPLKCQKKCFSIRLGNSSMKPRGVNVSAYLGVRNPWCLSFRGSGSQAIEEWCLSYVMMTIEGYGVSLRGEEPKKVIHALKDPRWIEAMQKELLQFKLQEVWTLMDLPNGKRAIGTKWVFRNKKDERGFMIRNKARLVAPGHTKEEGIDYDDVFAPVARIEAIRLFLAYGSFKNFVVVELKWILNS
nr:putative ribonuclease H-like domain-containing protein [Tanacetum cinerariifolium]